MRADEVQRAEVQRHHAGQRRDRPGVVDGAVGLDQHAGRDLAAEAAACRLQREGVEEPRDVAGVARLGQRDEGEPVARLADEDLELFAEGRVGDVVDAHAGAVVRVGRRGQQPRDHRRMRALGADRGAVLAVGRDVEHRPAFGLQRQRAGDEALAAGVVHARRQHRQRAVLAVQRGLRREHARSAADRRQRSRSATPARSSSSSFSVRFIRSREKSSIGRPWTTVYSPPAQVTGKPYMTSLGIP